MKAFHFASVVAKTLDLENLVPAYTTITFAMVNKTGQLGAYVDKDGNLVNADGTAFNTENSIQNVTFTDPGTGATVTLADLSTFATVGAHSITLTSTADTTLTLPTTGTLSTLAGAESLSSKTLVAPIFTTSERHPFVNSAVAAAGSSNSDAAALTAASMQHVTSDSAAKGWILPTSVAGYEITIINDSATAGKIYPDAGGNVNGATTTSGSVTVPASKGVVARCTVALTWIVFDLTAKSA